MHLPDKQAADLPQLLTRHWYSSCSWALIHSSRSSQRCRSLRLYFMVNLPSFLCDDSSPGFSGVWKVTRGSALELLAMLTTSSSDSRNSPSSGLPHTFSLSPLIKASLQPGSPSTSQLQAPKVGGIGDPRQRVRSGHRAVEAARLCRQRYSCRLLGFTIRCADRSREAGRVVVITSVVKRSQVSQGIDEPCLLIFNTSQLQEEGKKEVLNYCFPTGITYMHVQFQWADPCIMH